MSAHTCGSPPFGYSSDCPACEPQPRPPDGETGAEERARWRETINAEYPPDPTSWHGTLLRLLNDYDALARELAAAQGELRTALLEVRFHKSLDSRRRKR